MTKSRVIALVVASLVSSAAVAQAQASASAPQPQAARHAMWGGMRGGRGALAGIRLTDAEKGKLKEIHGRYATEGKTLRTSLKPAMQEARADRQRGDTAAARAVRERNKPAMEQVKALRTREQAEVRAALTPEQQAQFDANVAKGATRHEGWKKGHKRERDGADG